MGICTLFLWHLINIQFLVFEIKRKCISCSDPKWSQFRIGELWWSIFCSPKINLPAGSSSSSRRIRRYFKVQQDWDVSANLWAVGRPDVNDELVEAEACRIMRKSLVWYPYKPMHVVPQTEKHKGYSVVFYDWLLEQIEVLWKYEKWFVLRQKPDKQNEYN